MWCRNYGILLVFASLLLKVLSQNATVAVPTAAATATAAAAATTTPGASIECHQIKIDPNCHVDFTYSKELHTCVFLPNATIDLNQLKTVCKPGSPVFIGSKKKDDIVFAMISENAVNIPAYVLPIKYEKDKLEWITNSYLITSSVYSNFNPPLDMSVNATDDTCVLKDSITGYWYINDCLGLDLGVLCEIPRPEPPEPTIPTVLSNSFDLTKKIKEGEKILLGCEANIDDTILLQLVLVTKNDVQSLIGPSADGYKLTENSEEVFGSCFRTAQAMYEKSFTVADDMTSVKCVSHYTDKNNPCPPHNQFCIDLGQIRVEAGPKKDELPIIPIAAGAGGLLLLLLILLVCIIKKKKARSKQSSVGKASTKAPTAEELAQEAADADEPSEGNVDGSLYSGSQRKSQGGETNVSEKSGTATKSGVEGRGSKE